MNGSSRGVGRMVTDAVADFQTIVRQQIDLAVAELKQSARHALIGSILLVGALLVLSIALLLLIIAVGFGIAAFGVPYWAAFLLDSLIFVVIAVIMLLIAKSNASKVKAPTAAADNMQKSINEITATITGADN